MNVIEGDGPSQTTIHGPQRTAVPSVTIEKTAADVQSNAAANNFQICDVISKNNEQIYILHVFKF